MLRLETCPHILICYSISMMFAWGVSWLFGPNGTIVVNWWPKPPPVPQMNFGLKAWNWFNSAPFPAAGFMFLDPKSFATIATSEGGWLSFDLWLGKVRHTRVNMVRNSRRCPNFYFLVPGATAGALHAYLRTLGLLLISHAEAMEAGAMCEMNG